jgi:hypothetical protein
MLLNSKLPKSSVTFSPPPPPSSPKKKVCHADQLVLMTPSHLILRLGPTWYW